MTQKPKLLSFLSVATLCLASCSEATSTVDPLRAPRDAGAGDDASERRTMGFVSLLTTSPRNLIIDPEISGLDQDNAMGGSQIICQGATSQLRYSPTTPVGPGRPTLEMVSQANDASCTFLGQGGAGPMNASVWVGVPAGEQLSTTINLVGLADPGQSYPLSVDTGMQPQSHGGWLYRRYAAAASGDLRGTLLLSVGLSGAGRARVLAPEVLAGAPQEKFAEPHRPSMALARVITSIRANAGDQQRPRDVSWHGRIEPLPQRPSKLPDHQSVRRDRSVAR